MPEPRPTPAVKPRRDEKFPDGSRVYALDAGGTKRFDEDRRAWEAQRGQLKAMRARPVTESERV